MTPIDGKIPIAEDRVIWVMPSGERRPGCIAICAPEPDPSPEVENDDTWACLWFMDGIWHRPCKVRGEGSLQPLMLALEMIGYELHAFISRGGKVLSPEEPGSAGVLMTLRGLIRRAGDPHPADPVLADLDAEFARGDDES
jgi:hypothetical protein